MIVKKAPKDMTAVEFVDYLINGNVLTSIPDDDSFIQLAIIKDALKKPAPNPFTPDQVAWMREMQRSGWKYATRDKNCIVCVCTKKPTKRGDDWNDGGAFDSLPNSFLDEFVMWEDEEPFRLADYAPLEE